MAIVDLVPAALFTMVSGIAVTTPPTTSLALAGYPDMAGTASSILGVARFGIGALTAPLVGLGGASNPLPLGIVTTACALLGTVAYLTILRHRPEWLSWVAAESGDLDLDLVGAAAAR